jgi:uncharacterized protein (TIGR00369 family)
LPTQPPEGPSPRDHDRRVPFLDHLDVRLVEFGEGRGILECDVLPRHLRTLGIMHGGMAATLLDSVMGAAAGTKAPADHFVVTVQLNINFTRPAWEGETLKATGEVQHAGRQTAVARGEIRTAAGELVALGTATFMYLPHDARSRTKVERLPRPPS